MKFEAARDARRSVLQSLIGQEGSRQAFSPRGGESAEKGRRGYASSKESGEHTAEKPWRQPSVSRSRTVIPVRIFGVADLTFRTSPGSQIRAEIFFSNGNISASLRSVDQTPIFSRYPDTSVTEPWAFFTRS